MTKAPDSDSASPVPTAQAEGAGALGDEIEITPEMVAAGLRVLYAQLGDRLPVRWPLAEAFVSEVYSEMAGAR